MDAKLPLLSLRTVYLIKIAAIADAAIIANTLMSDYHSTQFKNKYGNVFSKHCFNIYLSFKTKDWLLAAFFLSTVVAIELARAFPGNLMS